MQLNMPNCMAQVLILMQRMVGTRIMWHTISTMLSSRHNSKVKHFHHHRVVRPCLRHLLLVLGVHHLHRVGQPTVQYRLHLACKGGILFLSLLGVCVIKEEHV